MVKDMDTCYLPASRTDEPQLSRQIDMISSRFMDRHETRTLLSALASPVLVLNERREIVFANRAACDLFAGASVPLRARPGEAAGCRWAAASPGGCGTSRACHLCGLINTVMEALEKPLDVLKQECRIQTSDNLGLVLGVTAQRMDIDQEAFVTVTLVDRSAEERRAVLERTFFHDVMNTANVASMTAQLLSAELAGDLRGRSDDLVDAIARLVDEIQGHRMLMMAENGQLEMPMQAMSAKNLLNSVARSYQSLVGTKEVRVIIDPRSSDTSFISAPNLVGRVLSNLVKNAVEAAPPKSPVTLSTRASGEAVRFEVHNVNAMAESTRLQVFGRSFSTKGPGRGIGTYSARLFTESYLGGKIGFDSEEDVGTLFWVELPQVPSSFNDLLG